jgi:predicted DNA-binding transcriptional regulator AlpA
MNDPKPPRKRRPRAAPSITSDEPPPLPRLYSKQFVIDMLGVSIRTVQRWRITLGFPHTKKLGPGTEVYLADAVDAWIARRLR